MSIKQTKQTKQDKRYSRHYHINYRDRYQIVFDLIDLGRLHVDVATGTIYRRRSIKCPWRLAYLETDEQGYLFFRAYLTTETKKVDKRGRQYTVKRRLRKAIAVHRLVWMVANKRRFIPKWHDVDHEDTDVTNNAGDNLSLLHYTVNRSLSRGGRGRLQESTEVSSGNSEF